VRPASSSAETIATAASAGRGSQRRAVAMDRSAARKARGYRRRNGITDIAAA